MCQKREEASPEIRLLRDLPTRANQKIADLERSIVELRAQHHLDVRPPLSTDADSISVIFLHELIAYSSIDLPKACLYSSLADALSYLICQCSPKSHRLLKRLPPPSLSRFFLNFNRMTQNPERLLVNASGIAFC
jgi:hypothetical protein